MNTRISTSEAIITSIKLKARMGALGKEVGYMPFIVV